jgi:hypothetical protein
MIYNVFSLHNYHIPILRNPKTFHRLMRAEDSEIGMDSKCKKILKILEIFNNST